MDTLCVNSQQFFDGIKINLDMSILAIQYYHASEVKILFCINSCSDKKILTADEYPFRTTFRDILYLLEWEEFNMYTFQTYLQYLGSKQSKPIFF